MMHIYIQSPLKFFIVAEKTYFFKFWQERCHMMKIPYNAKVGISFEYFLDYDFGVAAGRLSTEQMSTASFDKERCQGSKRADFQKRSEKLKQIAPVVPYDNDLKYWGSEKLHITPITKNDSLHKFWSHSEVNDDFIPHGLEESLRSRAICFAGKFEAVKWKCRAPMANGRLCERQDRYLNFEVFLCLNFICFNN